MILCCNNNSTLELYGCMYGVPEILWLLILHTLSQAFQSLCVYSILRTVAAVIGCLVLLRFSLRFLSNACKWLHAYFLAPWGMGRTDLKRYGPWASEFTVLLSNDCINEFVSPVVTGASEGIGRGYALEVTQ